MRREYISVDIKESGGVGVRDFELEKCGTRFSRVFDCLLYTSDAADE